MQPGGQINIVFFFLFFSMVGCGEKIDSPQLPVFSPCDFKEEMRNQAEDLLPPETRPAISNSYRPFVTEGAPVQDQAECVENGNRGS